MELDFKALTEATSGAVGGLLSTTVLYPLDTCKIKFQAEACEGGEAKYRNLVDVLREAVSSGKVLSLYQGLGTKNVQSVIAGFVYFYSYSFFKGRFLKASNMQQLGLGTNLVVAAAAGTCTCIVTQPWDTISARMQTSKPGESPSLLAVLKEGGLLRAFDGLGVSLLLTCNPAIQYTVYEQLKDRLLNWKRQKQRSRESVEMNSGLPVVLSAFSAFMLGALSKTIATVLTYPAIRCKVLMQRAETDEEKRRRLAGNGSVGPPKNMIQALHVVWRTEGLLGFYKGLHAQILKTVLAAALMLMVKEKVARNTELTFLFLHRALTRAKNPVRKAIAKYPASHLGGVDPSFSVIAALNRVTPAIQKGSKDQAFFIPIASDIAEV